MKSPDCECFETPRGLVALCWKLFKAVQSVYCCQNFYPDVLMTLSKNCASVYNNTLLYKHEKNRIKLWMVVCIGKLFICNHHAFMAIEVKDARSKVTSNTISWYWTIKTWVKKYLLSDSHCEKSICNIWKSRFSPNKFLIQRSRLA